MVFSNDLKLTVEDFFLPFYQVLHYGSYEILTNRDFRFVHYEDNLLWMYDFNSDIITFMTKVCFPYTINFVLNYMNEKHIIPNKYSLVNIKNIYILSKDNYFTKKENVTNIIVKNINIFKQNNPHASVHMFNANIEKFDDLNSNEDNKSIDNFDDLLGVC